MRPCSLVTNRVGVILLLKFEDTVGTNVFTDDSSNNHTVTPSGDAKVDSFGKFNQSVYLDGTGDYLDVSPAVAEISTLSSFTVECWVYPTDVSSVDDTIFSFNNSGWTNENTAVVRIDHMGIRDRTIGGYPPDTTYSSSIQANVWQHVALVFLDGEYVLYLDGVEVARESRWVCYAPEIDDKLSIGQDYDSGTSSASDFLKGYISDFRIVSGAIYKDIFTPPSQF